MWQYKPFSVQVVKRRCLIAVSVLTSHNVLQLSAQLHADSSYIATCELLTAILHRGMETTTKFATRLVTIVLNQF